MALYVPFFRETCNIDGGAPGITGIMAGPSDVKRAIHLVLARKPTVFSLRNRSPLVSLCPAMIPVHALPLLHKGKRKRLPLAAASGRSPGVPSLPPLIAADRIFLFCLDKNYKQVY